jgi:hypothetical protein
MTTTLGEAAPALSPGQTQPQNGTVAVAADPESNWAVRLRQAAAGTDPARAGAWVRAQRRAARSGKLSVARKQALDNELPGWAAGTEQKWLDSATDVVDFEDLHGLLPTAAGDDEERHLHRWLNYQRQRAAADKLSAKRRKWLDKQLPSWTGQEAEGSGG